MITLFDKAMILSYFAGRHGNDVSDVEIFKHGDNLYVELILFDYGEPKIPRFVKKFDTQVSVWKILTDLESELKVINAWKNLKSKGRNSKNEQSNIQTA